MSKLAHSLPQITSKFIPAPERDNQPGMAPIPALPAAEPPTPTPGQSEQAPGTEAEAHEVPSMTSSGTPITPATRSPLPRPLSPDLPCRDALYLFSNFSSYMRSPHEGSEGVNPEDFRDTMKLLDHARLLAAQPTLNVHILHLKYRFQSQHNTYRSTYSSGDHQLPSNHRDQMDSRARNPVPQPFSVLHDPVVKIDYMENGIFDPLPAQAVFSHIAKLCQPPPRIIVMSYVYSNVTMNHLSSLSTWALTASPATYIFSPIETRLREKRPLHLALHHAIPISMYAWPADYMGSPNPFRQKRQERKNSRKSSGTPILLTRRVNQEQLISDENKKPFVNVARRLGRTIQQDPIASLTIITSSPDACSDIGEEDIDEERNNLGQAAPNSAPLPKRTPSGRSPTSGAPPVDRIPLWQLAPGVGVLHGSTSASIGIRLSDFSAINLVGESGRAEQAEAQKKITEKEVEAFGIKTEVMDVEESRATKGKRVDLEKTDGLEVSALLEHPISRPSSTAPVSVGIKGPTTDPSKRPAVYGVYPATRLTPPGHGSRTLGRQWRSLNSQSWPAPISRVPGWVKGRKEVMEDTLEELNLGYPEFGSDLGDMLGKVERLALGGGVGEGRLEVKSPSSWATEETEEDLFDLLSTS